MMKKNKYDWKNPLLFFLLFTMLTVSGYPQLLGEERNIEINGYLMGHFSGRLLDKGALDDEKLEKDSDYLVGEERLRLDIYGWSDEIDASARLKVDIFNNEITDESDIDVREAYVDYTTDAFDFRLGRQVVTWGAGDLLFINDVYPKDWHSFFSGRPLEYLKLGIEGFRTRYSSEYINGEFLLIPFFRPDETPTSEDYYLFNPYALVPNQVEEKPDATFDNLELAGKLYRGLGGFDVAVYYYKGFWRTPSMKVDNPAMPTTATSFYPELFVHGASAQGNLFGGIVSLETGYYYSRDDRNGDDPLIPNSQMRYLTGYQRQLWEDSNLGIKYYDEVMEKYETFKEHLPDGAPLPKEHRDTVTVRLEQYLRHQVWQLSLFTFYSPSDNDSLVQPKVSYKFSDNFSTAWGANVFGGEKDEESEDPTFFGQFDKSDNLYLTMRYDF